MPDLDNVYLPAKTLYDVIEALKKARIEAHATTAEVSTAIGAYHNAYIGRMEGHNHRPSWTMLQRWAKVLGYDITLTVTLTPNEKGTIFPALERPEVTMVTSVKVGNPQFID